jgi:hypothetical protein
MYAQGNIHNSFILPLSYSSIDGSSLCSLAYHHGKSKFEKGSKHWLTIVRSGICR